MEAGENLEPASSGGVGSGVGSGGGGGGGGSGGVVGEVPTIDERSVGTLVNLGTMAMDLSDDDAVGGGGTDTGTGTEGDEPEAASWSDASGGGGCSVDKVAGGVGEGYPNYFRTLRLGGMG